MKNIKVIAFVAIAAVAAWEFYTTQFWKDEALRSAATTLQLIRMDSINNVRINSFRDTAEYWRNFAGNILRQYTSATHTDSLEIEKLKDINGQIKAKSIAFKSYSERYENYLHSMNDTILKHWGNTISQWSNQVKTTHK